MGNVNSDLTQSIKAQATDGSVEGRPAIYGFVGVSGDGELVRLAKISLQTKNFDQLDHVIQTEVVKFLLNEGKGENVN